MRITKVRQKMAEQNLDGLLVTDPSNRRYLSGFTGSAGELIVTAERAILVVDFRYFERAERESPAWEQARVTAKHQDTVVETVTGLDIARLGIESDHLTVAQWHELKQALPGVELVPLERFVLPLRAIKDQEEIAALKKAIACSDAAFAHLCQVIHPGMTELQVAWELESHMRQHGASALAFPIIAGSGPNGAMPHATSSERVIKEGEPIVMDFGAVVDGYCSDITRTLCLGQPDDRYLEIWNLVLEAQLAAEEQIRPGMTGQQADAIARDLFGRAGYGEQFGHGLGHGVGLNVHEAPGVGRLSAESVLEPGMAFTVEPGLYLPGWGGVRIEDIVLMHENGVEVLTQAPKEPIWAG